jgi:hypothetical protein
MQSCRQFEVLNLWHLPVLKALNLSEVLNHQNSGVSVVENDDWFAQR